MAYHDGFDEEIYNKSDLAFALLQKSDNLEQMISEFRQYFEVMIFYEKNYVDLEKYELADMIITTMNAELEFVYKLYCFSPEDKSLIQLLQKEIRNIYFEELA